MNRIVASTLAATLLTAHAAAAQQRPRQPQAPRAAPSPAPAQAADSTRPGPMGRGRGPGGLAAWLASDPAELGLTPDQLTRVRAARDEAEQANAPLRARLQAALANRDRRALTPADRRALMDSTRGVREEMRANLERSRTAVIGILTPAQQQTLDRIRPTWRTGGPMRGMRGGPRGRMLMRLGAARGGWMRPFAMRGAAFGWRAGAMGWTGARMRPAVRLGWRMGWRAGLRAEARAERFARRRAVQRAWRLERGRPWI